MVTKNAGDVLEDALKSITGLWDELLVDDDGSTDETVSLVTRYGGTVLHSGKITLGERKQWLIEKAKGKWILILDSDERISPHLREELTQVCNNRVRNRIVAYWIPHLKYAFGQKINWGGESYSLIRLFRRDRGRSTKSAVHEEINAEGNLGTLKSVIFHYSYRTLLQVFTKFTYYAKLRASEMVISKERLSLKKFFLYSPHMFYARFIKDKGYRDGWRGLVLALAFAYMEEMTYVFLLFRILWRKR